MASSERRIGNRQRIGARPYSLLAISLFALALVLAALSATASAAEIKVLAAGGMRPGLNAAAQAFRDRTGTEAKFTYEPPVDLGKRVAGGEAADIVVSSPAIVADLSKAGKVFPDTQMHLGRVGVGVVVRDGAPLPDISSPLALKDSLIAAEAVVYNTASSGTYIDGMLKKIGAFDQIQSKLVRLWDGTAVMHHLMEGKGKEFGFGGITDILGYRDRGLRLVGPLPAEIQNYASYSAAVITVAPNPDGAKAFMAYLASPEGRALFVANGIPQ
ncbi:MAG TPA: substrate-binding domain-containing protein [Xanthobacteraceae bacterium]